MLSRHHRETSSAYRRRKSTANHRRNTATNRCAVLHKVRPYSEISGGQYRRLAADVGAINSSTRQLVYSSSYKSYQFTGNKLTFSRLLTFESSPHTLLPLSNATRGRGTVGWRFATTRGKNKFHAWKQIFGRERGKGITTTNPPKIELRSYIK